MPPLFGGVLVTEESGLREDALSALLFSPPVEAIGVKPLVLDLTGSVDIITPLIYIVMINQIYIKPTSTYLYLNYKQI